MKAISLWQPWASLMAGGHKRVETRHWQPPMWAIGVRVGIHAAKTGLPKRDIYELLARPVFADALRETLGLSATTTPIGIEHALPRGAVVATAVLVRYTEITAERAATLERDLPVEFAFGDYTPGRFAWVFDSVERVDPPAEVRGGQQFFSWESDPVLFDPEVPA